MLGSVGLLIGLFLVPIWLVREAHGIRNRDLRRMRLFWWVALGHTLGMLVTLAALLAPPIFWGDAGGLRSVLIYWGLFAGAGTGGLVGLVWPAGSTK